MNKQLIYWFERGRSAGSMSAHWLLRVLCTGLLGGLLWSSQAMAQEVTLNLKDADIRALIGTVSEITGTNFIVDPRVKGKITVISARPMKGSEVYEVFLSVLKVHGYAAVPSGAVVKIVPDVNAKQDSIPTVTERSREHGDEMVTRVIQVEHVAAAQLVPILRPLVPQQGHLAAYPPSNVLIISDRANNVQRLVNIIRRIDQENEGEVELIQLQYASAVEIVRILTALSRTPAAGANPAAIATGGGGGPVLIADERTNSVLLSGDRSSRLALRAIISHLDTPMQTGGNTHVVYLKYAQATDIVKVLQGVGTSESKEKKAEGAPVRTEFDIQADEGTNALVITAPPDVFRSLQRVIEKLDVRRSQVLVEAIIAEVSSDKSRELGVQWLFEGVSGNGTSGPIGVINFTNVGTQIGAVAAAIQSQTIPADVGSGASVGGGRVGSDNLNFIALLRALSNDSNTNILSTPTLITMDNEEAEIVVGENVPFVTGSFSNTGATSGATNPFQTVSRQDVGLTLKIKPQISEGDVIKLEVSQEVSSLSSSTQAVDVITNKRSIKTTVLVGDGQVVVLGGLIEDRHTAGTQKVPFLGDLPLLGRLFRATNSSKEKTNLMVFIQPAILRNDMDANRFSQEKYQIIRAEQMYQQRQGVPLMPEEVVPLIKELPNLEIHSSTEIPPGAKPMLLEQ